MTANPTFLSPAQVADRFGVSPAAVTRWAKDGKLPFQRTLGGQRRFRAEDVEKLIAAQNNGSAA